MTMITGSSQSLVPTVPAAIAARLVSSAAYAEWTQIHDDFTWLRREVPLGLASPPGYDPFWVVSRHADILDVSRRPQIFRNNGPRAGLTSRAALAQMAALADRVPPIRSLVALDPPEHMRYRMLTFAPLLPKGIRSLESTIRTLARESIAAMAATDGTTEFVRDVALRFPLRVIMALMGLPRGDEDLLLQMTQQFFAPNDPALNQSGQARDDATAAPVDTEALLGVLAYFDALIADRRAHPRDDLSSVIASSRINGMPIPDWDATSYYITVLTAGHDTTSSSTAGGLWALAERPDLVTRLRDRPEMIAPFVDEAIRWTTPILSFMRTAAEDVTLAGQPIAAGDWLMLAYPSGNRDETVFAAPERFDIDRNPNPHVAFGHGAHLCLGQHLAKLEMRIFFEELLPRLKTVALAGSPQRPQSIFIGGVKSLPLTFEFAS